MRDIINGVYSLAFKIDKHRQKLRFLSTLDIPFYLQAELKTFRFDIKIKSGSKVMIPNVHATCETSSSSSFPTKEFPTIESFSSVKQ